MNNKSFFAKRIPTILGILILAGGLIAGVLLVGRQQSLTTKAGPTSTPKNVRITNRSSTSFTVSWITDIPVTGFIKYSDDPTKLTLPGGDTRDQIAGNTSQYTTHYVDVTGLTSDKTYYLEIGSGPQTYNDSGKPYQVRTTTTGTPPAEDVISGNVVTAAGAGVSGGVVYVDIDAAETLSALTKSDGTFRLALSTARDKQGNFITYDKQKDQLSIFVQAGVVGTATAITNTANANPVPEITIGKTQNFVGGNLTPITVADLTSTSSATSTGFSPLAELAAAPTQAPEATYSVKLLNPSTNGESLATNTPEFLGTGPIDLLINLVVGPIASQAGVATVSGTGNWAWTAPDKLSYGGHTITLSYKDALGATQSFSRDFTVLAPGEAANIPAFTATPSATTTPSATPTATGTATPTDRPSMPSTSGGVPQPGAETPTIILLLAGTILFFGGFALKKRMSLY